MALRAESTVVVPGSPVDVFPWLVEADRVPRWMSGLERYEPAEPGRPLGPGSRIHQVLIVSGQRLQFELHVTGWSPPDRAELAFAGSGFEAVTAYTLVREGDATRVTWDLDGQEKGFKARLLAGVVQGKLQEKLDADLSRLRDVLAANAAAA